MYTIGEISKIVNISANTLRYYDEIGLLKPSLIQNNNQYRYYSDLQVKDIIFILELKQYGFSLGEIKELMENKNKLKFKQMLEEKQIKLNLEIERLISSSILLENRISQIICEEELNMENRKILIVDDLEIARVIIKNIIEEHGFTSVGEVSNGKEAITAYEKFKPDLVIMDIVMPIMDGIDAAKEITKKYNHANIIMCSGVSSISAIMDSFKAGAKDFISKPLCSTSLINSIKRNLEKNCYFEIDKFENTFNMLTEQMEESLINKPLAQKDVDIFIHDILRENCEYNAIKDFSNKISNNYINVNRSSINQSLEIEENIIANLKDRAKEILIEFSNYLFEKEKEKFSLNVLAVESITMSEFGKLINGDDRIGIIKFNDEYSKVYIHLNDDFKDEYNILKEILSFIENKLQIIFPKHIKSDIVERNNDYKEFEDEYSIVLISFDIQANAGHKGFAEISIPYSFLKYCPAIFKV